MRYPDASIKQLLLLRDYSTAGTLPRRFTLGLRSWFQLYWTTIRSEGITFTYPGIATLQRVNQEKLKKFKPEYLYSIVQLTAVHSLEAFVGKLDFDKG